MGYIYGLGATSAVDSMKLLSAGYSTWAENIRRAIGLQKALKGADDAYAATLNTILGSADRLYNAFIAGDAQKGQALTKVMVGANDLVRELRSSNLPTVIESYNTTVKAVNNLVLAAAKTVGAGAGAALKAAADAAGVDPKDVGSGAVKLAIAAAVALAALAAIKMRG